jgi:hypothetical protein
MPLDGTIRFCVGRLSSFWAFDFQRWRKRPRIRVKKGNAFILRFTYALDITCTGRYLYYKVDAEMKMLDRVRSIMLALCPCGQRRSQGMRAKFI